MHFKRGYHDGLVLSRLAFCTHLFQRAFYAAAPDERLQDADALHACNAASAQLYSFVDALIARRTSPNTSYFWTLDASAACGGYTAVGVFVAVERWSCAAFTPVTALYTRASACIRNVLVLQ